MIGYSSGQALVEASQRELMERFEVFDEEGRPFPSRSFRGAGRSQARKEPMRSYVSASLRRVRSGGPSSGRRRSSTTRGGSAWRSTSPITERRRTEETLRDIRDSERRRIARDLHDGVLQDLSYTAAAMGLIMLEVEGTDLEGELRSTTDAVRRAAQGLRDAVNDLRLEEERDRPFPELVKSLVRRNRARTPDCEITLEVEDGFPRRRWGRPERSCRA